MTGSVQEQLASRRSVAERMRRNMAASAATGLSATVAAFESQQHQHQQQQAHGQGHARRFAGPPPPRTWVAAPQTRPATRVRSLGTGGALSDLECTCPSLAALAARAIAKNLHSNSVVAIHTLSFHLKELVLHERARLSRLQDTPRLASICLKQFVDPRIRILNVSHTNIDLSTLSLFLPRTKKRIMPDVPPDSWDDEGETPSSLSSSDSDEDDSGSTGLHIHTLDLSFTRPSPPLKLCKLITMNLPNLYHLSIAGCFDSTTGPSFLSQVLHGLINLCVLDISCNAWVDKDVVTRLPIQKTVLGLLKNLIVREVGCDSEWIVSYVRNRRADVCVTI
ncbi:hypothetical protein BCR33DRAFT_39016 [Rhizoclosmatium globosum]|uniref:RNI-like protein n=1 Tax=Rhizoclosmatium globosum TaxID=329046 RepID=A0A1Y2CNI0_9FUNG|nr:hypothetical protein BCR33DRAFT_39016 [Rhizoclosmatium globosum]|eukprot:ORY48581.1 hypothetical protein BCR33DRAFT_39016 [Rhizoclosmatium globosum]